MAANDIYQVKFHQTFGTGGRALLNVFYYRQMVGSGDASDFSAIFQFYMLPAIAACVSSQIKFTTIEIINLDNPADYDTQAASTTAGALASSDCLPAFVCWAFRLGRTTRAVRNGQKRFAGIQEADQADGAVTGTGINNNLNALATMLGTLLVTSNSSDSWAPRIFRPEGVNSKNEPVERADFPIGSVSFVGISTQNSRKN